MTPTVLRLMQRRVHIFFAGDTFPMLSLLGIQCCYTVTYHVETSSNQFFTAYGANMDWLTDPTIWIALITLIALELITRCR